MALARTLTVMLALTALVACENAGPSPPGATLPAPTLTPTPPPTTAPVNDRGTLEVLDRGATYVLEFELNDNYFDPTFVVAAAGSTATLDLHNAGSETHTFTVGALGVDVEMGPMERQRTVMTLPQRGEVLLWCRFHGEIGMRGAFRVR